jgi:hypothetical protein
MSRVVNLAAIALAVVVIVSVALGAQIFRWEMILWPSMVICWVVTAWIYETMSRP